MKLMKASTPKGLFTDALILGGLGMVFYGLHIHWPWAAYTVVGSALVVLGVWMIR